MAAGSVKMNQHEVERLRDIQKKALLMTMETVYKDLLESNTLPYDTGNLYRSTYLNSERINDGTVELISDTPYAARLYFHPEYNFSKSVNINAGGRWFDSYISGEKKDVIKNRYAEAFTFLVKGGGKG